MVDFPTNPFYGPVTRVETSNIPLGGDLVNQPNLALYQLVQRTDYLLNLFEGSPVVSNPIPTQVAFELSAQIVIDLDTVFTGTNTPLNYSVILNTDPTKVTATVNANNLELDFPLWTSNFVDIANIAITVRATDSLLLTADNTFNCQVSNLSQLFTVPYYEFVYTVSGTVNSGASIYVDAAERDFILGDPILSTTFTLANGGAPVFQAVDPSNPSTPPAAIDVGIEGIYRFRYVGVGAAEGSYLYTGEAEAATVRGNPDFLEESSPGNPAFQAFLPALNRQQSFKRYRYLARDPNGDYIYSIGSQSPNLPPADFSFEGTVCGVKQID